MITTVHEQCPECQHVHRAQSHDWLVYDPEAHADWSFRTQLCPDCTQSRGEARFLNRIAFIKAAIAQGSDAYSEDVARPKTIHKANVTNQSFSSTYAYYHSEAMLATLEGERLQAERLAALA